MERFKGGGDMEMSGERRGGEEDNLVQLVVDDLRKKGRRETSSDNRGREREGERAGVGS